MNKVLRIEEHDPEAALENLNRVTGLDFHSWPESLIHGDDGPGKTASSPNLVPGDPTRRAASGNG